MNKTSIPVYIAVGVVLVLAVFSVWTLFADKEPNSPPASVQQAPRLEESVVAEAQLSDGVQTVNLSWGKFNYAPDTIRVKQGIPVKIVADTTRLLGCFRSLAIPDMGVNKQVTEADNVIEFTPQKKGTFRFSCAMGMGSGTLEVV